MTKSKCPPHKPTGAWGSDEKGTYAICEKCGRYETCLECGDNTRCKKHTPKINTVHTCECGESHYKECYKRIDWEDDVGEEDKQGWEDEFDDFEVEYNEQAEGCGLEDRGIQNRYEALEHGYMVGVRNTKEMLKEFIRQVEKEAEERGRKAEARERTTIAIEATKLNNLK